MALHAAESRGAPLATAVLRTKLPGHRPTSSVFPRPPAPSPTRSAPSEAAQTTTRRRPRGLARVPWPSDAAPASLSRSDGGEASPAMRMGSGGVGALTLPRFSTRLEILRRERFGPPQILPPSTPIGRGAFSGSNAVIPPRVRDPHPGGFISPSIPIGRGSCAASDAVLPSRGRALPGARSFAASNATFWNPANFSNSWNSSNLARSAAPARDASGGGRRHGSRIAAEPGAGSGKLLGLTWPSAAVLPEIDFKVANSSPLDFVGDLLLLGLFESAVKRDEKGKFLGIADPGLASLDDSLGGVVAELAAEPDFKGKPGTSSAVVVRLSNQKFKYVAIVGLGKRSAFATNETAPWQKVGASVAALVKQCRAESTALAIIPSEEEASASDKEASAASEPAPEETAETRGTALGGVARGVLLGSFQDVRFKSDEGEKAKAGAYGKSVTFLFPGEVAAEQPLFRALRTAAGSMLTRELVNAPPNVLIPEALAQAAVDLASAHSDVLSAKILSQEECEALGMGSYLAVAAASTNPPKFIHLTYTPPPYPPGASSPSAAPKKLAIIGKGLTFDSGGYNLKAGAGSMIHLMKFDMGGAAATLGAAKAVASIQPKGVEVHFIVAACENMISGTGLRPGDIITASNGKTIEVNNTDAEGRLTLADALVYASKLKVEKIVDIATLTGACIVALGNDVAGLFTPSDAMAAELSLAAKVTGEKVWRMPMEESYWEGMKSSVADMVNTGPREGGSITAALFLKQYVDEGISWAHLDMAGPVWNYKKSEGTGYAANLLYTWVELNSSGA